MRLVGLNMRICAKGIGLYAAEVAQGAETLTVAALLFYEGSHASMDGKTRTYSAADVEAIATATQDLLSRGSRIKLFADHRYTQGGTLGTIDSVEAREIESPPHEGMDEIVGLTGIYGQVTLRGQEAIAAYQDKRLKEISAGIDLDGTLGIKNSIFEVSAVGVPSLAGAALFGLTIDATARAIANGRDLWQEWELFTDTIRSIEMASEDDLDGKPPEQWRAQAVEDFAARLRQRFPAPGTVAVPTVPNVPLYSRTPMELTAEEIKALQAENEALKAQLAEQEAAQAAIAAFSKLKDQAIALRDAGKLSPAEFKEMGFDDQAKMVALFGSDRTAQLTLQVQLDTIQKFRQAVQFGSALSGQPLPEGNFSASEEQALAERVKAFVGARAL